MPSRIRQQGRLHPPIYGRLLEGKYSMKQGNITHKYSTNTCLAVLVGSARWATCTHIPVKAHCWLLGWGKVA